MPEAESTEAQDDFAADPTSNSAAGGTRLPARSAAEGSGKDPSKVDRSAAYFCRFVTRQLVQAGICRKAEIQVAYAIGVDQPVSVRVETFGCAYRKVHPRLYCRTLAV